ncbi:MAG: HD domain-containing protein [Candidatus Aenigmatarchaeota archaeon]
MNLLKFFDEVSKLKEIKRTGWVERGVKGSESIADHSFMVALQTLVLGYSKKLNIEKVLKMAIVHDIVESITGDIITKENWPSGGTITEEKKYRLEKKALNGLLINLSPKIKKDLINIWVEFEFGKSKEAVFVRSIDKFEGMLQAMKYKKSGNFKKPLDNFWSKKKNINAIKDKGVRKILLKIVEQKNM